MSQEHTSLKNNTPLDRAKQTAERIVASMREQGYREVEYILTECQLKIVASGTGKSPRTQYLSIPTNMVSPTSQGAGVGAASHPKRRFILS